MGQHIYFLPYRNSHLVLVLFISKRRVKKLKRSIHWKWRRQGREKHFKEEILYVMLESSFLYFLYSFMLRPLFSIKMFSDMVDRAWLGRTGLLDVIWMIGKAFTIVAMYLPCYSWYPSLCPNWLNIFYRYVCIHQPSHSFQNKAKEGIVTCYPKAFRDRKLFPLPYRVKTIAILFP